jgi:hydrogenase maturation factor HypE
VEILTVKNRKGQESVKNEKQKHDLSKSLRKDPATKSSRQVGADNPILYEKIKQNKTKASNMGSSKIDSGMTVSTVEKH